MNVDKFMDYCDQMMIAEEKIDVSVLDGFGNYDMTLYHASPLKLSVIEPNSWNIGNRLSPKKRKSSFWTNDMRYAILWGLDWVTMRVDDVRYIHDIENYKFYVRDEVLYRKGKDGEIAEVIRIDEWIFRSLRKRPVYVYQITVPKKIVSKGQYNINEYTIDIPMKPEKVYTITEKEAKDVVEILDDRRFEVLYNSKIGDTRKRNPNLRERLIYRSPAYVGMKRTQLYKKEYNSYGHADPPQ